MTGRRGRLGVVLLTLFGVVLFIGGCGSEISGTAKPAGKASMIDATSPGDSTKPSKSGPSGHESTDSGGDVKFDVDIGQCVNLGGTVNDAKIDHAVCGGPSSNYRVIGKAPSNTECVSDADSYYYETLDGVQQGALCLDVDWVAGGCMDLGGEDPKRIDCSATASEGVRVVAIQSNTDSVDGCPSGQGHAYEQRRFVVCFEDL